MKHAHQKIAQHDFPTLLTDSQQHALERVQSGLQGIDNAVKRVNLMILEAGLNLPFLQAQHLGVVYSESLQIATDHEWAVHDLRRAAGIPEKFAA